MSQFPICKLATVAYRGNTYHFCLEKRGQGAYRWVHRVPFDSNPPLFKVASVMDRDHLTEGDAIRSFREWQDKEGPEFDLTILPVADKPATRAAKRIFLEREAGTARMAEIIEEETHIQQVTDALNTLAAHVIAMVGTRIRQLTPILLTAIEAVEAATGEDLASTRRRLTEEPSRIVRPS